MAVIAKTGESATHAGIGPRDSDPPRTIRQRIMYCQARPQVEKSLPARVVAPSVQFSFSDWRWATAAVHFAVMGAFLNASLGERYRAAVNRAAGGDADLGRLLSDPNALLQPAVRSRIPEAAYSEVAGALAASLSPAFWVLFFFGLSALAVATLFPHGTAKDLVSREEDYG